MSLVEPITIARRVAGSSPVAVGALVLANLVPLAGVLFFGWDVMTILVLYWLENGIVGLFNVARMAIARGPAGQPAGRAAVAGAAKVALIPFFLVHYGIFWVVHGVFVVSLPAIAGAAAADATGVYVVLGAAALLASHGVSFSANYIGRGEYRAATIDGLFIAPYGRVVVLHLTVLLGGFAALGAGWPPALVALLVVFKTGVDLLFHLREHALARPAGEPAGKVA